MLVDCVLCDALLPGSHMLLSCWVLTCCRDRQYFYGFSTLLIRAWIATSGTPHAWLHFLLKLVFTPTLEIALQPVDGRYRDVVHRTSAHEPQTVSSSEQPIHTDLKGHLLSLAIAEYSPALMTTVAHTIQIAISTEATVTKRALAQCVLQASSLHIITQLSLS